MQVIRIQPDEAIYLKINNKVPGLGLNLDVTKLDLTYRDRFEVLRSSRYLPVHLGICNSLHDAGDVFSMTGMRDTCTLLLLCQRFAACAGRFLSFWVCAFCTSVIM